MKIETAEGVVGAEDSEAMELPRQGRSQMEFGNEGNEEAGQLGNEEGEKALGNQEVPPPVYVLYHDHCADGFAAAYVCWRKFGEAATYLPVQYGQPVPEMLRYVEDRDLWRWQLWMSREFSAGLALEPFEFARWHELAENALLRWWVIRQGVGALRMIAQTAKRKAAEAQVRPVGVWHVPAVNCTAFISETCEAMKALFPHAPFVAAYFDNGKGQRIWSLRCGPDFDVSGVAKAMGGGGHPQAAGFVEAV